MLSVNHLFELSQQIFNRLGNIVKEQRQNVSQYYQAGDKKAAASAANNIHRALALRVRAEKRI